MSSLQYDDSAFYLLVLALLCMYLGPATLAFCYYEFSRPTYLPGEPCALYWSMWPHAWCNCMQAAATAMLVGGRTQPQSGGSAHSGSGYM
jgi:hypothetical protein